MKKKIISFLRFLLRKLDKEPLQTENVVYIYSDFQTKKGGISIVDAQKLVANHCLEQAKRYVTVGKVSGHEGYEKAIASIRISNQTPLRQ